MFDPFDESRLEPAPPDLPAGSGKALTPASAGREIPEGADPVAVDGNGGPSTGTRVVGWVGRVARSRLSRFALCAVEHEPVRDNPPECAAWPTGARSRKASERGSAARASVARDDSGSAAHRQRERRLKYQHGAPRGGPIYLLVPLG